MRGTLKKMIEIRMSLEGACNQDRSSTCAFLVRLQGILTTGFTHLQQEQCLCLLTLRLFIKIWSLQAYIF